MPAIPGIAVIGQKIIREGLRIGPAGEYPLLQTCLPDDITTVHVYHMYWRSVLHANNTEDPPPDIRSLHPLLLRL
jgi:hypothetical protein